MRPLWYQQSPVVAFGVITGEVISRYQLTFASCRTPVPVQRKRKKKKKTPAAAAGGTHWPPRKTHLSVRSDSIPFRLRLAPEFVSPTSWPSGRPSRQTSSVTGAGPVRAGSRTDLSSVSDPESVAAQAISGAAKVGCGAWEGGGFYRSHGWWFAEIGRAHV